MKTGGGSEVFLCHMENIPATNQKRYFQNDLLNRKIKIEEVFQKRAKRRQISEMMRMRHYCAASCIKLSLKLQ